MNVPYQSGWEKPIWPATNKMTDIPLPAWPLLNDRAGAWIKKREAAISKAPRDDDGDEK